MDKRTEMRQALLELAWNAVEDKKEAKLKKYTRRPHPSPLTYMPGINRQLTREERVDIDFMKLISGKDKQARQHKQGLVLGIFISIFILDVLINHIGKLL